MEESTLILFAVGGMAAGFVAGLTGLGTALTSLAFWLHVAPPQVAVPLAAAVAVQSHIITLLFIRHGIVWPRVWPFLVGGLIGLPAGVLALSHLDAQTAKAGLGLFLIAYCLYGLTIRQTPVVTRGGRPADGAVGAAGGFLGGLAGLSGPLPTIWAGLRGWPKDEQRGVYQPFNLLILALAAGGHFAVGRFGAIDGEIIFYAFVAAAIGAVVGILAYRRTSDRSFRRLVLGLLLIGGLSHIVAWLG